MKNFPTKIFTIALAFCVLCNFQLSNPNSFVLDSKIFDENKNLNEYDHDKDFENDEFSQIANFNDIFSLARNLTNHSYLQKEIFYNEALCSVTTPPPDIA